MVHGVRELVLAALCIALVTVATMVIRVPAIAIEGYLNFGDAMIFVVAALLGPRIGFLAGGIGSGLADLLGGFAHWAPWTFVIKGAEGLIAALIIYQVYHTERTVSGRVLTGLIVAAAWMNVAYYIAGGIIYGFGPALANVPMTLIQGGVSVVLATALLFAIRGFDFGLQQVERDSQQLKG